MLGAWSDALATSYGTSAGNLILNILMLLQENTDVILFCNDPPKLGVHTSISP